MATVVGITFRRLGRPYWFDPGGLDLDLGERVIVETAHGLEVGTVRVPPREMPDEQLVAPLKPVVRRMTADDEEQYARNAEQARSALEIAAERIAHFKLPMKLLSAECAFDCSQVTIYFTAENRVDFRELVRDLSGRLRSRVQLYQLGARDHTKILGGYGTCGRELCCRSFLADFAPVSMRMAKDQSLFLNPAKFSGVCGKLMCCLRFEHETYKEARSRLPAVGDRVVTPHGAGIVLAVSVLRNEVTVSLDETEAQVTLPASEIQSPCCCPPTDSAPPELNTP
jgi:cell fate regulator YaaT (PSP1 superfamily)